MGREEKWNRRIREKLFVCMCVCVREREWKEKWELQKLKVGKKIGKYQENWNSRKFRKY